MMCLSKAIQGGALRQGGGCRPDHCTDEEQIERGNVQETLWQDNRAWNIFIHILKLGLTRQMLTTLCLELAREGVVEREGRLRQTKPYSKL